jgi:CubicO group peptidase (beta-lactamase class C family)
MKKSVVAFALCVLTIGANAQAIPDSLARKIDAIFSLWNNPASPGCVIGVIRNDSLIYAKGYGMANLEYAIPNSPETIFHMASISKQFTAYSILQLANAGLLSLDDDIHKYLTWFPDLKEKITIRHLLNHTSGIRDQWQLLAISGTRLDDVITQDQIIKLLSRQQALNSRPGEKYNYCNSGFTMLAEIVKSVTGKTLRQFSDSSIFKPLGMNSTHFHDDYTEIEKNRAYSYQWRGPSQFSNSILSYSNSGATSLFTNMNDLSKWVMNFYNYTISEPKDIEQLTEKGKLNNGFELNYALGIISNQYKGWRQYTHGGADAGYRTNIAVFPDLKTGFIVFGNVGNFITNKMYDVADLFLRDTTRKNLQSTLIAYDSSLAVVKDSASIKKILGNYISEEGNMASIEIKDGMLMVRSNSSYKLLFKETDGSFSIPSQAGNKCFFSIKGKDTLMDFITPQETFHLKKYHNPSSRTEEELMKYTGTYYCPELEVAYAIFLKNNELFLGNIKYNDSKIRLTGNDHLNTDFWWMNHLVMLRDKKGTITGFEVNAGRITHLKFNKIK